MRIPFHVGRRPAVKMTLCALVLTLLSLTPSGARAQGSIPPPDINGFVQTGWHAQVSKDPYAGYHSMTPLSTTGHGFFLSQARLYFTGQVDGSFGYVIQTNFAGGAALLTAFITWDLNETWQLRAGQMLKPFGRDRTRPRHQLLTLDRSAGSNLLITANYYGSWDVGAMLRYHPEGGMTFLGGVFNGRPTGFTTDNDTGKDYVARAVLPLGAVEVGVNASYLRVSSYAPDDRSNLAWGVDALYTAGPLTLEGEILSADRHLVGPPALKARDVDLTGALDISPLFGTQASQFVLRVEQYDPDTDTSDDEMLMVIPSLNLVITAASRIQVGIIHQAPAASGMDAGTSGVVVWQVNFF